MIELIAGATITIVLLIIVVWLIYRRGKPPMDERKPVEVPSKNDQFPDPGVPDEELGGSPVGTKQGFLAGDNRRREKDDEI